MPRALASMVALATSLSGLVVLAPSDPAGAAVPVPGDLAIFAGTGSGGTPTAGPATSSKVTPSSLAVDSRGNVFVTSGNYILKITPAGTLSTFAGNGQTGQPTTGSPLSSPMSSPVGLSVDSNDNVYASIPLANRVVKINNKGTSLQYFAGDGTSGSPTAGSALSTPVSGPTATAWDSSGNAYIVAYTYKTVMKVNPSGNMSIFAGNGTNGAAVAGPATSTPIGLPKGIGVDSSNNVYIADRTGWVLKVNSSGNLSIFGGTGLVGTAITPGPATSSWMPSAEGLWVDSSDNVFVGCTAALTKITPSGTLSIVAGTGVAGAPTAGTATSSKIKAAQSIVVDRTGTLYFGDTSSYVIAKIYGDRPDPPSNVVASVGVGDGAASVAFDAPSAAGASAVTGYTVSAFLTNGPNSSRPPQPVTSVSGTASPIKVTGLDNSTVYYFQVVATNNSGSGNLSNPSAPVSPPIPWADTPTIANLPAAGSAVTDGSFTPTITTNGDGVKSVTSSTTSKCTVDDTGKVAFIATGTCTLTAHVATGVSYAAADGYQQSFTILRGNPTTPTISNLPSQGPIGDSFTPTITTNGDGVKSVTSQDSSICSVDNTGKVNFVGGGYCWLTPRVGSGTNYNAANGGQQGFPVAKAPSTPTISNLPSSGTLGDSFDPTITTDSSGVTSVTSSTTDTCSVSGSGKVSFDAVGTCTLVAHVARKGYDYLAADGSSQSFSISGTTASTPTIANLPDAAVYGGSFTPSITTNGDGLKSVTSSTPATCSVDGSGMVSFAGAGTCTLVAHVARGPVYLAADGSSQSFTVGQAGPSSPTIANLPSSAAFGGSFTPSVTTTGDGLKSVTSSTPATCSVDGSGKVSFVGAGTCTLLPSVAAGTNYLAADGSSQSFTVGQAGPSSPTITNLPSSAAFGGSFTPSVTTNGDGVKSVTSSTPATCSVDGSGKVSFVGAGTCTLVPSVAAGTNYLAADGSSQSFTIGQAGPSSPTITNLPSSGTFRDSFTPSVTTTGDGVKSVTSLTPATCSVDGSGKVSFVGTGTCMLVPSVSAGTNYLAADGSSQSFTIGYVGFQLTTLKLSSTVVQPAQAYSSDLGWVSTFAIGRVTWAITAGLLPRGLQLNTTTGVISGRVNRNSYPGGKRSTFTVTATTWSQGKKYVDAVELTLDVAP